LNIFPQHIVSLPRILIGFNFLCLNPCMLQNMCTKKSHRIQLYIIILLQYLFYREIILLWVTK
jgi:hypothetical protein